MSTVPVVRSWELYQNSKKVDHSVQHADRYHLETATIYAATLKKAMDRV